jgi:hypothetical protein
MSQLKIVETTATGIRTEVVTVSPAIAEAWLKKNHPSNRAISRARVECIVSDILSGAWRLTHQGIAFDGEGWLIDGQHRLTAIVEAEVSVPILVAWNDGASFHDPIDRASPRTIAMLTNTPPRIVSALRTLMMLECGANKDTPITVAGVDEAKARHEEHVTALTSFDLAGNIIGPSLGACLYAMPVDPAAVLKFAQQAAAGEMLSRGDAAYAYRAWRGANARRHPWVIAMATLNCIRFASNNRKLTSVHIGESGYRAVTTRRRTLRVPNTPSRAVVDSMIWNPTHDPDQS